MLILFLRLVRLCCGLVVAFIFLPLLSSLINYGHIYAEYRGEAMAIIFLQLIIFSFFVGLFFALRKWINKIYYKEHGELHPQLGKSPWAL